MLALDPATIKPVPKLFKPLRALARLNLPQASKSKPLDREDVTHPGVDLEEVQIVHRFYGGLSGKEH